MTKQSTSVQFRNNVLAEIAKIEGMESPEYKTSGLHYPKNSNVVVNIKTASTGTLITICADLFSLKEAMNFLNLEMTRGGYTISEWLEDTKTRAIQIKVNGKLRKLSTLAKDTEGILTGDEIKEIKFNSMTEQFENLLK